MTLILLAFAIVCALLASVGVGAPRFHLGWMALALYLITLILR